MCRLPSGGQRPESRNSGCSLQPCSLRASEAAGYLDGCPAAWLARNGLRGRLAARREGEGHAQPPGGEFETYHLTCPVCGALPGTSCMEDFQELERVHPSRRMSVAERNRRHAASGWEPPELAERRLRGPRRGGCGHAAAALARGPCPRQRTAGRA